MLLVYVDDAGNTWEQVGGFFKDGPYVLHSGILVNEEKYFHLERMFYDLFSSTLKVKDWRSTELHAYKIWHAEYPFENLTLQARIKYFAEFIQMLTKLSIKIVIGVQQKKRNIVSATSQSKYIKYSQYAFLHALEHTLSNQDETGILISDAGDKIETLSKLLYQRSQWRYNPGADKRSVHHLSKYKYETLACFLLDQMHFVSSKDSFFIQIVDHVSYLLQRVLTYSYLKEFPQKNFAAKKDLVPITEANFKFFAKNLVVGKYNEQKKDVEFTELSDLRFNSDPFDYLPSGWVKSLSPFG